MFDEIDKSLLIETKELLSKKYNSKLLYSSLESLASFFTGDAYSAIINVAKGIANFREKNFMMQITQFFLDLYDGIPVKQYQEYIKNISKRNYDKEIARVIKCLDMHSDLIQARVLAKIFLEVVFERITVDEFFEMAEINKRMMISDFDILYSFEETLEKSKCLTDNSSISRLKGLGLLYEKPIRVDNSNLIFDEIKYITSIGKKYKQIVADSFNQLSKLLGK